MIDNEVLRNIRTRFSCRKFVDKPVEDEKLRAIIEAGTYAPSGHNEQSWHFTIIRTEEGKRLLLDAAGDMPTPGFLTMHPDGVWPFQSDFCGAPVVIMISGRTDVPWPEAGPMLAAENIMLAAQALGLSALWSTLFTKDLFRDEKSAAVKHRLMPPENKLFATLFLGYPAQVPETRPPRRNGVVTWL
jgi:nitroreductase